MKKLQYADEEYYLASEYILKLASRSSELFKSSELQEKRLLLKMALQNLKLDGKKVRFTYQKPFDTIANYASRSDLLPTSPFALYEIFTGESIARVKNQLEVLKRVLVSEPKYAVVKVSNGEFAKL